MAIFEMIKYHKQQYPSVIPLRTEEVAGHFDVQDVTPKLNYSLHTEYSYGKRIFRNSNLKDLTEIISASKNSVPQLWKNEKWGIQFAEYILRIVNNLQEPSVIEIHPPFDDYTDNISDFFKRYKLFDDIVKEKYPGTDIYIENRCGSVYSGGKFVVSKLPQLYRFCEEIDKLHLKLKIAFDIPQLYTAHGVTISKKQLITELLNQAKEIRQYIGGVHLWGKGLSENGRKIAHYGDFNSYFNNDIVLKNEFLIVLGELFDDKVCRRLVLEVNSNNSDILSIIQDLDQAGFRYI